MKNSLISNFNALPKSLDRIIKLPVVLEHLPHVVHVTILDLIQELGQVEKAPVVHVTVPLGNSECVVRVILGRVLVPVYDYYFLKVTIEAVKFFDMGSVLESRSVPEEPVHDILIVGVHAIDDGPESHPIFHSPDNNLEVWITDLRQEDIESRPLLEPPSVFMCPVRLHKAASYLQHYRIFWLKHRKFQRIW